MTLTPERLAELAEQPGCMNITMNEVLALAAAVKEARDDRDRWRSAAGKFAAEAVKAEVAAERLDKMVDYLAQTTANGGFGNVRTGPDYWRREAEQQVDLEIARQRAAAAGIEPVGQVDKA